MSFVDSLTGSSENTQGRQDTSTKQDSSFKNKSLINTQGQQQQEGTQESTSGFRFDSPGGQQAINFLTGNLGQNQAGGQEGTNFLTNLLQQRPGTVNPYIEQQIGAGRELFQQNLGNLLAKARSSGVGSGQVANQGLQQQLATNALNQLIANESNMRAGQVNTDIQRQQSAANQLLAIAQQDPQIALQLLPFLGKQFQTGNFQQTGSQENVQRGKQEGEAASRTESTTLSDITKNKSGSLLDGLAAISDMLTKSVKTDNNNNNNSSGSNNNGIGGSQPTELSFQNTDGITNQTGFDNFNNAVVFDDLNTNDLNNNFGNVNLGSSNFDAGNSNLTFGNLGGVETYNTGYDFGGDFTLDNL